MWNILIQRLRQIILRNYTRFYGFFHRVEKKVLFSSFAGKQYSDNPRAISEKMHELYPEYQLVWALNSTNDVYGLLPDYIQVVNPHSLSFYKEIATCQFFVTNEANEPKIYKEKTQCFVQTWHGDRGFKKILYEVWEDKQKKRPIKIIDDKISDFFVIGSDYGAQRARDAFHYNGELFCVGMPRNDKLISCSGEYIEVVRRRLGLNSQDKVVLYAPTFRDSGTQKIEFDLEQVMEHLNADGDNWVCLLRSHSISGGLEISAFDKYVVKDVTDYPDMADILLVSDILLTDYSSSSGDFILKNEPVILLHYDLEEYNKRHRTFRISPEEAGYFCVKNDEELINLLDNLTDKRVDEECNRVKEFFGIKETGQASELVCRKMMEEEIKK